MQTIAKLLNSNVLSLTQESQQNSLTRQEQTQLAERYGSREQFLSTFHVNQQVRHTQDVERCVMGSAPTLAQVNDSYGDGTAQAWLVFQLAELSEYCGARDKLTQGQIRQLSALLLSEYWWLKVTEFELFFRRLKLGRYGHYYGSVDPMVITEQLRTFIRERSDIIDAYEQQKRHEELEKHLASGAVTYKAYLRIFLHNVGQWVQWTIKPPSQGFLMPFSAPSQIHIPKLLTTAKHGI